MNPTTMAYPSSSKPLREPNILLQQCLATPSLPWDVAKQARMQLSNVLRGNPKVPPAQPIRPLNDHARPKGEYEALQVLYANYRIAVHGRSMPYALYLTTRLVEHEGVLVLIPTMARKNPARP